MADDDPSWLAALLNDPEVVALGLRALDADQRAKQTDEMRSYYGDPLSGAVIHTHASLAASRAAFARGVAAVAVGPQTLVFGFPSFTKDICWMLDPGRAADGLLLALSDQYPPFLWIPAGTTARSVSAALAEFVPVPASGRLALNRVERGFLCYRGEDLIPNPYHGVLDAADFHEISRHAAFSAFLDVACWGTAQLDDPWLDRYPDGVSIHWFAARLSEVCEFDPDRVPAQTYRTRHSRSQVSFQAHQRDLLVGEARYRPSRHTAVVERVNAELGTDYPADMPVDVIGILLRFMFLRADRVRQRIEAADNAGTGAAYTRILGALTEGDLAAIAAAFRPLLRHPAADVRAACGSVAFDYNLEFLLHELSLLEALGEVEQTPDCSRFAENLLYGSIPPPKPDPGYLAREDEKDKKDKKDEEDK